MRFKTSFHIADFQFKSHNKFESDRTANKKFGFILHQKFASNRIFRFRFTLYSALKTRFKCEISLQIGGYRFRLHKILSSYGTINFFQNLSLVKDNWFLFRNYSFCSTRNKLRKTRKNRSIYEISLQTSLEFKLKYFKSN